MSILNKPLAVIKVGGDILQSEADLAGLKSNLIDLKALGWHCIILHGGGPQVNALQASVGLTANKVAGRRITSKADLVSVKQAIAGQVNVDLVASLSPELPAFGCHGASCGLIKATKRAPMLIPSVSDEPIDFGEVGDVVSINTELLANLLSLDLIPVIATLGIDGQGNCFNINADTTVSQIAKSLQAELLIMSTQVGGVFKDINDASSIINIITPAIAEQLISDGIITDGMIPKIEESLALVKQGVGKVVITAPRFEGLFKQLANSLSSIDGSPHGSPYGSLNASLHATLISAN
jgi:acetylglutamate kinase